MLCNLTAKLVLETVYTLLKRAVADVCVFTDVKIFVSLYTKIIDY